MCRFTNTALLHGTAQSDLSSTDEPCSYPCCKRKLFDVTIDLISFAIWFELNSLYKCWVHVTLCKKHGCGKLVGKCQLGHDFVRNGFVIKNTVYCGKILSQSHQFTPWFQRN